MNEEQAGLLGDGTYRARWLRAVIKAAHITESVRVLLMTLALHMDASGRVSVPRDELAALLGRNERKVAERVKLALESGLLVRAVRGQKHRVAVYRAAMDGVVLSVPSEEPAESDVSVPPVGPAEDSQGAGSMHPEPNSQGAGSMHPETQGAGFRMLPVGPAENSQGAPRGARPYIRGVDVHDDVDLEASNALFDVEESSTTPEPEADKPPSGKRAAADTEHPAFAEWYRTYPIHKSPAAARKAFNKAVTKVPDPAVLIDAAERYHQDPDYLRGFGKHPATWLNGECWLDEAALPARTQTGANDRVGNGSGSQVPPRGTPRQNPFRSKRKSA